MFSYLCTACGKKHTSDTPFAAEFTRQCLRCGAAFRVTAEMAQVIAAPAPAAPAPVYAPAEPPPDGIIPSPGPDRPTANGKARHAPTATAHAPAAAVKQAPAARAPAAEGIVKKSDTRREIIGAVTDEEADQVELRAAEGDDEADDEGAPAPEAGGKKAKKSKKKKDEKPAKGEEKKAGRPPFLVLGLVLVILIGVASGGYYFFSGKPAPKVAKGGPKPPPPQKDAGQKDPPKDPGKLTPPADSGKVITPPKDKDGKPADPKDKDGKSGPVKPTRTPPVPVMAVSAPALSAELERSADEADKKYAGKVLLVSGLFQGIEAAHLPPPPPPPPKDRPAPPPPPVEKKVRLLFKVEGAPVRCEAIDDGGTPPQPGGLVTVVGKYEKGGQLVGEIVPPAATADFRNKDKVIELTGLVQSVNAPVNAAAGAYPSVKLEGDLFSRVGVECFFPRDAAEDLRKLAPRSLVTVRGTCGTRRTQPGLGVSVRLDDCQIVTTTGPRGDVRRVDVRAFLREYEEDLRADYIPPFGQEEEVAGTLTVEELAREHEIDPRGMARKYKNKRVTVRGLVVGKGGGTAGTLESGLTRLTFQVSFRLDRDAPEPAPDTKEYTVKGVCMEAGASMSLVYARELNTGKAGEVQRLTAEFLPHAKGRILTYDVATYPRELKTRAILTRQVWFERDGGQSDTVTTHSSIVTLKSIFTPPLSRDWVKRAGVSRSPRKGPVLTRTEGGGLIEIGERPAGVDKGAAEVRTPVIKLGAKAGDTWEWKDKTSKHTFTLERFEDFKGKPCAVVRQVIRKDLTELETTEIERKFASGIGVIQRREVFRPTPKERKVVSEHRLLDVEEKKDE